MLSHAQLKWNPPTTRTCPLFQLRAVNCSLNSEDALDSKHPFAKLRGMITTLPPVVYDVTS